MRNAAKTKTLASYFQFVDFNVELFFIVQWKDEQLNIFTVSTWGTTHIFPFAISLSIIPKLFKARLKISFPSTIN